MANLVIYYRFIGCTDEELIFQLLNLFPEENANLTKPLTHLVNNFCLNQIISLTEKVAE